MVTVDFGGTFQKRAPIISPHTRCQLSSHEARLDSHTKLERFSTVCRVTAAPVLRTQITTHLSPTSDQVCANFAQAINTHVSLKMEEVPTIEAMRPKMVSQLLP